MTSAWVKKANGAELLMNFLIGSFAVGLLCSSFWFFFFGDFLRALSCVAGWFVASAVVSSSIKAIEER